MDNGLAAAFTSALIEAKELHHIAVGLGQEIDENWPVFYGRYLATKVESMNGSQERPVAHVKATLTVDGHPVPQADGDGGQVTWELDGDTGLSYPVQGREIGSRFHVGE